MATKRVSVSDECGASGSSKGEKRWDIILFGVDDSGELKGGSVGGDGSNDSSEGERRWGIILFFDVFNI